jgi:membrane-associated phospholipid phosphatase
MMLNTHHTSIQDTFFRYYTQLAEWPLYVLALIPLLYKKKMMTLYYALSEGTAAIVVTILKHLFHADRPIVVFENYPDIALPLVEGVRMHHSNSFPSGHTSTFFVFATCCVIILAYRYLRDAKQHEPKSRLMFYTSILALLALAALGGYSRIYLSQHFLSDVCVGSIIGIIAPFVVFFLLQNKLVK